MRTEGFTRPSSRLCRLLDLVSELTGLYRLSALLRGNSIALGATVKSPSRLILGKDVVIQSGSILHAGGKRWCDYQGAIVLGPGVRIGPYCVIYGAGGVELGAHTHLGPGVKLMSQAGRHSPKRTTSTPDYSFRPIVVGPGCWIGAGAVLLGGVRVGANVSVAPNSVVFQDVPDFAVVAGNPARVVRIQERFQDG